MSFGFPREPNKFPILSKDALTTINNASLEVLEKTGIKIRSEKCLEILEDRGCNIDRKEWVARIPSYVVLESLKKGRSMIRLGARNPGYNVILDGKHAYIVCFGTGTHTIDPDTGKRRISNSQDIVRAAKISDALDSIHIFMPTVTSHDVPVHIRNLHDVHIALSNNQKHVMFETGDDPVVARFIVEIASTICGSSDKLRKNPIISSVTCPISPLVIDGKAAEAFLIYARAGVPICFATCCMPGATGPVTLAGSLVLGNAEVLGGLVLVQSVHPGAPFIYGGSVAPFDMRTARRAGGAVEHGMMSASMGQFGRYHGLPSAAGGFYTTANQPGSQACLEKSFCGLLPFANSDIVEGFGCLEDGKTLAFEQLVIDAEIARMFHRVARGIEISDTTLAVDLINKVKPQGSYLTEEHTNHHLRKEHLIPVIIKRQLYETWTKDGSRSMEDVAREKVKKIIETHSIEPLDEVVQDKVAEIVRKADNKLSALTG